MKSVILIRHTKSDWSNLLPDFDRPIRSDRHDDAMMIAGEIARKGAIPKHIIASHAKRTMQTAKLICAEWDVKYKSIETEDRLYEASHEQILSIINNIAETYDSVAIVCHNPGITDFINRYSKARIDNVPTTGAALLAFDAESWRGIENGGMLKWFLYPKGLKRK